MNIFAADGHRRLSRLQVPAVTSALDQAGAVLFRGFEVTNEAMTAFVGQFSREVLRHPNPARAPLSDDRTLVMVDANHISILAHSELTYVPGRPDLQWFWCLRPAATRGETTLCDAVEVWARLKDSTRETFLAKRLKWQLATPCWPRTWRDMFGVGSMAQAVAKFSTFSGFTYCFDALTRLTFDYTVSAMSLTRVSQQPAFANNVLAGGLPVVFEDDSPIPEAIRDELVAVTRELESPIAWQAGDVVMIDNSRYMHGRRAFADRNRQVAAMISNANWPPNAIERG